ncbi:MAG TPA: DUF5655 domain-containing protein [Polyangiaceae bacterium]|nr:DUF5655 domain-containing protein [Polyangiaceae bacterium]
MAPWRCLSCGRTFGRTNQSHECEPALSLERYLSAQPPPHRAIYRAVLRRLQTLGELDVDPVQVGIMIKRHRTFCELRPKRAGVELSFKLSRPLAHARIRRSLRCSTHRQAHFVLLTSPREVDAELLGWLAEAYFESPE